MVRDFNDELISLSAQYAQKWHENYTRDKVSNNSLQNNYRRSQE